MTKLNGDHYRTLKICNKRGLHARASAKFVTLAGKFDASVSVSKDGNSVCGTSIMGLMMLTAAINEEITLTSKGNQSQQLLDALEELIINKFDEDE